MTTARTPVEEQTLPRYHERRYYPVKPGQILQDRYRTIAKLGFGAYSTVWLGRDERSKKYVSLKVCVQDDSSEDSPVTNEISMLERLRKFAIAEDHPGQDFTRLASDMFTIDGTSGRHWCIVMEPHASSVRALQEIIPGAKLPKALVKSLIHRLLFSINWLHATCGVVHTDISPQNVLTLSEDEDGFRALEEQESLQPSSLIHMDGEYAIYGSRNILGQVSGIPILADFGQMRTANPEMKDWWMSDLYRAPEVLLGLPWSFPVDVWSLGVMTLELLEGRNLFHPIDYVHNQYVLPLALAQYIGYLGPPPPEMLSRSPFNATYFDREGTWVSEPPIPQNSFEDFVTVIPPGQEKTLFLQFIRKMLTWDPEVRATSNEMIEDEWLMTPEVGVD